jgi:hypothetical protein
MHSHFAGWPNEIAAGADVSWLLATVPGFTTGPGF